MTVNPLFPQLNGFVHGGDYNPDQWLDRPDILQQDIELMKKARINCVTLGVFSWAALEPREGEYHFEWLSRIIDDLYANGIHTILATPSGARPAWLDEKYPDAMRVDAYGIPNRHGMRHNHCPSSENYRRLVRQMDTHLAQRFARHPGVLMWHIGNEFGGYCYCERCKKKFQNYLRNQFGDDIQRLNSAWWAAFWSHSYNSFDQIEPPYSNGENSVLALLLEWNRFTTWNTMDFIQSEIDALRPFNPALPVTTNFMDLFPELDYHKMAPQLDAVSWDSYPRFHNDYETLSDTFLNCAFNHALFRSMEKDRPFLLMESAPGLVNWNPVNKYRRPGIHKLAGLQAVACGSDSVQYFQIRKSRGSFEQHHGAVIDHVGTGDTRIFREVEELGQVLDNIREVAGTLADNKIAVVFDWNCRWAVKDARALADETKNYEETCRSLWRELVKIGLEPDIVPADGKWDGYKIVIAPMMYITSEETGKRIAQYVADGGVLIGTYFSAYVDENLLCHLGGFPGAGLKDVFGLVSEEIDTFYPSDRNHIQWLGQQVPFEVRDYAELIRLHGAQTLAYYTEDYVKGEPAVTRHSYGKGTAYYLACRVDSARLRHFFASVAYDQGLTPKSLPEGVEYHVRYGEKYRYEFYLNTSGKPAELRELCGTDLLSGRELSGTAELETNGVLIVKSSLSREA